MGVIPFIFSVMWLYYFYSSLKGKKGEPFDVLSFYRGWGGGWGVGKKAPGAICSPDKTMKPQASAVDWVCQCKQVIPWSLRSVFLQWDPCLALVRSFGAFVKRASSGSSHLPLEEVLGCCWSSAWAPTSGKFYFRRGRLGSWKECCFQVPRRLWSAARYRSCNRIVCFSIVIGECHHN